MNDIITFIITDRDEENFVQFVSRAANLMDYGNAIVLHEAKFLKLILKNVKTDFRFRIIIHLGQKTKESGWTYLQELKEDYKTEEILLITRDSEMIPDGKDEVLYKGSRLFDATFANRKSFVDGLKVFNNSEIRSSKETETGENDESDSKIKFGILTALATSEFKVFKDNMAVSSTKKNRIIGKFSSLKHKDFKNSFFVQHQSKMGMVDASIESARILKEMNPKLTILSGVCGGREGYVKIYDLIIPGTIIDVVTGHFLKGSFYPTGESSTINEDLFDEVRKIVTTQEFRNSMLNLIPASNKYDREREIVSDISVYCDTMACGPFVLKSKDWLENKAKKMDIKIAGFEMESYGVGRTFDKLSEQSLYLVIKSVMDFTDENKKDEAESSSKVNELPENVKPEDKIKELACYMSYLCTRSLLKHLDGVNL